MRLVKRELTCPNCKQSRVKNVSLENDEPDDFFDDLLCDPCYAELKDEHDRYVESIL